MNNAADIKSIIVNVYGHVCFRSLNWAPISDAVCVLGYETDPVTVFDQRRKDEHKELSRDTLYVWLQKCK